MTEEEDIIVIDDKEESSIEEKEAALNKRIEVQSEVVVHPEYSDMDIDEEAEEAFINRVSFNALNCLQSFFELGLFLLSAPNSPLHITTTTYLPVIATPGPQVAEVTEEPKVAANGHIECIRLDGSYNQQIF